MECHTTLERVLERRAMEKCIKDSDFKPSVLNSKSLVDTVIGVGESGTRKPSEEQSTAGPVAKIYSRLVKHVSEGTTPQPAQRQR